MTTHRSAKNTELMLQADDIHVADVEKIHRAPIRRQILFLNLESDLRRIIVTALDVVHRHGEALPIWKFRSHSRKQVGRERGDAAPTRKIIAEKRDCSDFGCVLHKLI